MCVCVWGVGSLLGKRSNGSIGNKRQERLPCGAPGLSCREAGGVETGSSVGPILTDAGLDLLVG